MKLKNKREILFIVVEVLLLLITIGLIIYSLNFLIKNTRDALNPELTNFKEITKFNFEGLKKLGIVSTSTNQ